MCLYTADTIVILVLIFLCRKLLQVPGLTIGSGAYVGHSGIFKKLYSSKSCATPGSMNSVSNYFKDRVHITSFVITPVQMLYLNVHVAF